MRELLEGRRPTVDAGNAYSRVQTDSVVLVVASTLVCLSPTSRRARTDSCGVVLILEFGSSPTL